MATNVNSSNNNSLNNGPPPVSTDDSEESSPSCFGEHVEKPTTGPFPNLRYFCGNAVNHPYSVNFILLIILMNTMTLILGTFDFVREDPPIMKAFNSIDIAFLAIFTVESGMQLTYHLWNLFRDPWLCFEFMLVIFSWFFPTATALRSLRILKVATRSQSLKDLIDSLVSVVPNIGAIFGLLVLIFYVFAVMFTQLFKECDLEVDYFSRLDKTLFSLFQFMTMDFQEASRDTATCLSWAPNLFVCFVIVSGFVVFNLIIAVLAESLNELEKKQQKRKSLKLKREKGSRNIVGDVDDDGDNYEGVDAGDNTNGGGETMLSFQGDNHRFNMEEIPVSSVEQSVEALSRNVELLQQQQKEIYDLMMNRLGKQDISFTGSIQGFMDDSSSLMSYMTADSPKKVRGKKVLDE